MIIRRTANSLKTLALGAVCAAALAGSYAAPASAEGFTPEQKKELESMMKDYIMQNGQVLIDSVEKYRMDQDQKTQATAQEKLKEYLPYYQNKDLPMAGNPDGDVTIVEYFDYNCGYCKKAYEDVMNILKEDKNVRVVFQEMPILSPASQLMAATAEAAHRQGKYFEIHQALMEHRGPQTEEEFIKIATEVGLDIEKIKEDAKSEQIGESIKKSMTMANDLGIRGTPGFIIGDAIYPGYIGLDGMKDAIARARKAKAGTEDKAADKAEAKTEEKKEGAAE